MKITRVTPTIISIPRADTLTTSYGSRSDALTVIVEIETDAGITGIGQTAVDAPFYGEPAEAIVVNIYKHLGPAVIGKSPLDIELLNRRMHEALPEHFSARAGVDLALWDLKGKALNVPVYQLLGGRLREGVSLMGFVRHAEPQVMYDSARATLEETPYPVLKMKIGLDVPGDIERFRAVSAAVAGKATIQVDGNTGYSLAQAITALSAMEKIGNLGMIEQPVARLDDMAALARRFSAPLMADESIFGHEDAIDVVKREAAQVALLKITKHGGLLNVLKIAHIADAAGIDLSVAIYYDIIAAAAAHVAAALPAVRWPSPPTGLQETILTESIEPTGLMMYVPDGPGFGVALDYDKVKRFTVSM
ncbi:MAG: mandelate racemase/muconate lactonizing enzyme family protein [Chloroflexales bacterium]|nr:mandelate racemase/muconate lactonizing enzyme family protein [Chloroflexales bacterium]